MANFEQAIKWMKEGKKVCRSSWCTTSQLSLIEGHIGYNDDINFNMSNIDNFEATDWKIYNEDKDWNLAKEVFNRKEHRVYIVDVRKCKDLILDDIANWDGGDHLTMNFVKARFGDI